MNLQGRRAIVTGAASGIGLATVGRLRAGGARVAAFDVVSGLVADDVDTHAWLVDVADEASVSDAVEAATAWLGGVDVLVHSAGIMRAQRQPVDEIPLEVWDQVIAVNLRGSFLMVKHVTPRFDEGSGVIVLVSSVAGIFFPSGSFPYGASKGGMHGFAMTLEERLKGTGIRINEVCPGSVHTPLLEKSLDEATTRTGDGAYRDEVKSRWVGPEQVAEVIAFLASPEADVVRGTIRTA